MPSRWHPNERIWARCPRCRCGFDLLAAPWCGCGGRQPSKLCPACGTCACGDPDYANPLLWSRPPERLRALGFASLFTVYGV